MGKHAAEDQRDDMPVFIHSELDDFGLTPFEFRAYAHLARRVNDRKGEYYEKLKNGADVCRMDVKTYRAALVALEEYGLVSREERPGQTSVFRLNPKSAWRTPTKSGRATKSGRGAGNGRGTPTESGRPTPTESGSQRYSQEGSPSKVLPSTPQTPHEPATVSAAAVEERDQEDKADLEDLTPFQRRQATRPPDKLAASRLATYHPQAWNALIDFRRMHGEVRDAQFNAWARAVAEDVDAHGERIVAAALQVTIENFPALKQPFSFYRACVRRAATDAPGRNGDLSAPAVMSQADLDRMFELAKEGALA